MSGYRWGGPFDFTTFRVYFKTAPIKLYASNEISITE